MAVGITLDKERGLGDSVDDAVGGSAIGHSGQACERSLPGMENTVGGVRARSSISREIVEDSSGDLKITESA